MCSSETVRSLSAIAIEFTAWQYHPKTKRTRGTAHLARSQNRQICWQIGGFRDDYERRMR